MEKEILEKIKLDIEDIKKLLDTNLAEMKELEQHAIVKRYMRLARLKYELDHGLSLKSDYEIVRHEYWKYTQGSIQETNEIWFLVGIYNYEEYYEAFDEKTDNQEDVLVYINLENEQMHIGISLDEREDFESTHNVIVTNKQNAWHEYYKTRETFFMCCINEGQEAAIKRVLKKKLTINQQ